MKKFVFLWIAMAALMTSCISVQEIKSDKPVKSEKRHVQPFERVRLFGSPTIYYAQTNQVSLRVEAPEDLLEFVETEVSDSCLTVKMKDTPKSVISSIRFVDNNEVKVYVTSPDLIDVSLYGSGDFKADNHIDTDNLKVELKGSGNIDFADIVCDQIKTTLIGSGDVSIGHVTAVSSAIELVGSGDIDINHESTGRIDIMLKGSGDIKAGFQGCGDVVSELRGSGDITLFGDVRSLQNHSIGSGSYHTKQLKMP